MSDISANVTIGMPPQLFTAARSFKALPNGKIYIGKIDTDPTIPENQIQVYIENEDGSLVPVPQPIVINAGGFPVYNGQIKLFKVKDSYSMAVYDSYGAQQFYFEKNDSFNLFEFIKKLLSSSGAGMVGVYPQGTLAEMQYYVTPDQFSSLSPAGKYVDENTDFNACIQAAINYASEHPGVIVRGTNKRYGCGGIVVTVGCKAIEGLKLKCLTPGTDTVIRSFIDTGHDGLRISLCDIDINQNATKGIVVSGVINSTIENNKVYNFSTGGERYGIRIGTLSVNSVNYNNKIINNIVTMPTDPDEGIGSITLTGIGLIAVSSGTYGGIDNGGAPIYPSVITLRDTFVYGNIVNGGTHGLQGGGIFRANITHNTFSNQSHRNINLSSNCQRVQVVNNYLLEGGSSGVNIAWGCRWIDIIGNYIQSNSSSLKSTDDTAIQCYKGVTGVNISNNQVLGDWKYSVYLVANVSFVNVTGNILSAGSVASICVESDWAGSPKPSGAIYSRGYDPSIVPVSGATNEISISGNVHSGSGCAYALGGFNGKVLTGIVISDEIVGNAVSRPHILYVFDTNLLIEETNFKDIKARGASSSQYFSTNGRAPFTLISNVTILDDASSNEIAVTSATPTAWIGPNFIINSPISVTNFLGGKNGQKIRVRMIVGAGISNNSSLIRLKGNVSVTSNDANSILYLERIAGIWFETSRNF